MRHHPRGKPPFHLGKPRPEQMFLRSKAYGDRRLPCAENLQRLGRVPAKVSPPDGHAHSAPPATPADGHTCPPSPSEGHWVCGVPMVFASFAPLRLNVGGMPRGDGYARGADGGNHRNHPNNFPITMLQDIGLSLTTSVSKITIPVNRPLI